MQFTKRGVTITLEGAKEIVRNRLAFTNNMPHRVLVIDEGAKLFSKEARDYLSKDGASGIIAGAVVIKSVYGSFLGNFFLKLTNPPFPSRLFTDEKHAQEWLEQFHTDYVLTAQQSINNCNESPSGRN